MCLRTLVKACPSFVSNSMLVLRELDGIDLNVALQELGVSILQDLHRQRQTITHSRDTLHGADDNIARARKVLSNMSRRITTNKLIMVGIILLLLTCIILVVYYKFIKK